jgi:hypothetical protein
MVPMIAVTSLALTSIIGFKLSAVVARIIVFHDHYAYSFEGSTRDEAISKCQVWANRAGKNPNRCSVTAVYP